MPITLEAATEAHIPELIEMMADFYAIDNYPFDEVLTRHNLHIFLREPSLGRLWLIRYAGQVAGYVALTYGFSFEYGGRTGLIDELYLRPFFRSRGIGHEVMTRLENEAVALGLQTLQLEVEKHNEKGNRLYARHGYRANERRLLTRRIGPGKNGG